MAVMRDIHIEGVPGYIPEDIQQEFNDRVSAAVRDLLHQAGMKNIHFSVATDRSRIPKAAGMEAGTQSQQASRSEDEATIEQRAEQYQSRDPLFDFDFLVVPEDVRETLVASVDLVRLEDTVFDKWNLRLIEPFPRAALNFHGPPGTGKTLAAHALANYLGKKILPASYATVESKYVGDGAKNIEALFFAAERDGSVLFIDEADSLLSRRLTEVTQGAEQAINSMRSQLLICLEKYTGIVIFSTNLVQNYDRGFETRMRHVHFPMPDEEARCEIWKRHLPSQLPLADSVAPSKLAKIDDLCGRDIKNAVIDAALRAARAQADSLSLEDLQNAAERVKGSRLP